MRIPSLAISLLLAFAVLMPGARAASLQSLLAPKAELWPRWTAHDESATAVIDNERWSEFLARYRILGDDGIARVAYGKVDAADRAALVAYINDLARIPIGAYSRREQFAYWVNLYNALTVRVVLDAYPVKSIRDIDLSKGLFSSGPWDAALIAVDGEPVTLNDIEHRILRPIWKDPRIHYAVNCASLGCPNLAAAAFTGARAEMMLDEAARDYVNAPRGARLVKGRLTVSRIYDWYGEDFGGSDAGILAHLRAFAMPDLRARLDSAERIDAYAYDWSLNDAR